MGFFDKIKQGFKKTSDAVSHSLDSVFAAFVKIDEDLLEELEEALILSDVGASTSAKIVAEVDYRQHITLPIDDFFKFANKAMVSATPIVIDDPRFEEQEFKIIKIRPTYDYSKELELKPTNNVEVMLKQTLNSLSMEDTPILQVKQERTADIR